MKKIFIALSVLAVLGFSIAPVLANVPGARDIAPGSEFKTYFLVSAARVSTGAGPSTLLQISETKGKVTSSGTSVVWSKLHFNFYTVDSVWVHDVKIPITRWQSLLTDIGTLITNMSDVERAALAVTFNGEAYYAGYIQVTEIAFENADNILADVLQLDLGAGQAAIANIPMKCYMGDGISGCEQINRVLLEATTGTATTDDYEVFSGHAMAAATNRVWNGACADATWFALYPRYLINDTNSADTYWIFLRSSVRTSATNSALVAAIPFHTWVINKSEEYRSTTINIREMSILSAKSVVPDALKVTLPYVGQVNLKIPGEQDPSSSYVPSAYYLNMELFGWNWKFAKSASAAVNWAGMSLIGADAGTIPSGGYCPSY